MEDADIESGVHAVGVRTSPEYFQRELRPNEALGDVPEDWADALEDEQSLVESIELYPRQLTRQDLTARLTAHLSLCKSRCWRSCRPEELVANVSRVLHPAGA
jgi:hypothetical protein